MSESSDQLSPVELLAEEFLERQQRGENPTIGEYCERHPELADEIREIFEAVAMVEELKPNSNDATGTLGQGIDTNSKRPDQVGDYRILREVGRGGMGVVYEAEQESLKRRVALKVMPRNAAGDEKSLIRFQREARAAARMHHTNIVPVFEVGEDELHVFYAMQLIQGQALDLVVDDLKRLRTEHVRIRENSGNAAAKNHTHDRSDQRSLATSLVTGRFHQQNLMAQEAGQDSVLIAAEEPDPANVETVIKANGSTASAVLPGQSEITTAESNRNAYYRSVAEIGLQTARALAYAHARGIVHRDIKPSNLILDSAGVVWVTDFGLAKTSDEGMTHTGDILGTIRYMSPERFQGHCDVRADIYSLGLTIYELLLLRPAFASPDRLRLIEMVTRSDPPSPRSIDSRIPLDLETIILKCGDKDPRRRYQSADELCEDLERFVQDEPIKARRISLLERVSRWGRRNKGMAAAVATVVGLILCVAIGSSIAANHLQNANENLENTLVDLESEKERVKEIADENRQLAEENQQRANDAIRARQEAVTARDEITLVQEKTRRNLYAAEINMAHLAGLNKDFSRRQDLLSHWQTMESETDLRGFEYYYLLAQGLPSYQEFRTHGASVFTVAWDPQGKRLASGSHSGLHICDVDTGEVLQKLIGHAVPLNGIDWSADGSQLVSVSFDGALNIWDVNSGQTVASNATNETLFRAKWSPTGDYIATGGAKGSVKIWDAKTARLSKTLQFDGDRIVYDVAWNPDGSQLAFSDSHNNLCVYDIPSGKLSKVFKGHRGNIVSVDWRYDGQQLVTASGNGECFVWSFGKTEPVLKLEFDGGFVNARLSPNGEYLALPEVADKIRIHSAKTGEVLQTMEGHKLHQWAIDWCADSKRLATGSADCTVRVYDVSLRKDVDLVETVTAGIKTSNWSSDGRFIALGLRNGHVQLRDAESNRIIHDLVDPDGELVRAVALEFIPGQSLLAAAGAMRNDVLIWDTETGELVTRLVGPEVKKLDRFSGIRSLAWNHAQGHLAAGTTDGNVVFWDLGKREQVKILDVKAGLGPICFVPGTEGRWLITGHGDNYVRLWDTKSDKLAQEIKLAADVHALDCNSRIVAAAGGNWGSTFQEGFGFVSVWSIEEVGETIRLAEQTMLSGPQDVVRSIAFTPDGKRLLAGDASGNAYFFDVNTSLTTEIDRHLLKLSAGKATVDTICISPTGTRVIAATEVGEIWSWDAIDGYEQALSPNLLESLDQRISFRAATAEDLLLRAKIFARQGNWSAAAKDFRSLSKSPESPLWFVTDLWMLDGHYPPTLETPCEPESILSVNDYDVLAPVTGPDADGNPTTRHWQPQTLHKNTAIDFGELLKNRSDISGYALWRVYSVKEQTVGVLLGSDDLHRLWLNGEIIHEFKKANAAEPDEHAFPVTLQRGWNSFLIKVRNFAGQHSFFLSLSNSPLELAPAYQKSRATKAAAEMWDLAIAENPLSPQVLTERARFLWRNGRRDEAEKEFDRLLTFPGSKRAWHLLRARQFGVLNRHDDALAEWNRLLELDPNHLNAFVHRADCFAKIGNFRSAAGDIRKLIEQIPGDHFNYYELGALLLEIGDQDAYRKFRTQILDRWGQTKDSTIAERMAKVCLLLPSESETLGRVEEMVTNAPKEQGEPNFNDYLAMQGMLMFRQAEAIRHRDQVAAGKLYQAALGRLGQARSTNNTISTRTHYDVFAAMILHRLDRPNRAVALLNNIETVLDEQRKDELRGDFLMQFVVFQEAAKLIYGQTYQEFARAIKLVETGNVNLAIPILKEVVSQTEESFGLRTRLLGLFDQEQAGIMSMIPNQQDHPVTWEFATSKPEDGWQIKQDKNRTMWKTRPVQFENIKSSQNGGMQDQLWLRKEFDISEMTEFPISLRVRSSKPVQCFINGVLAVKSDGTEGLYQRFDCSPQSIQALKKGTNILAIQAEHPEAVHSVDAGLYVFDPSMKEALADLIAAANPRRKENAHRRSRFHVAANRWTEAALDFEVFVKDQHPNKSIPWMVAVTLSAVAISEGNGDVELYERLCGEMANQFRDSRQAYDIERCLKCCLLLENQNVNGELNVDSVQAIIDGNTNPGLRPWFFASLGLHAYRNGEYPKALEYCRQSRKAEDQVPGNLNPAFNALLSAVFCLTQTAVDNLEQAKVELANGNEVINELLERHGDLSLVGRSCTSKTHIRHDSLIAHVLLREAARELRKKLDSPE